MGDSEQEHPELPETETATGDEVSTDPPSTELAAKPTVEAAEPPASEEVAQPSEDEASPEASADEAAAEPPAEDAMVGVEPSPVDDAGAPPSVADGPVPGSVVTGRVTRVTQHSVYLDLPDEAHGLLGLAELREADGREDEVAEGEEIAVYVLHPEGAGDLVRLSRIMAKGGRSPEDLPRCLTDNLPVEGKITARRKGGYDVYIAGQRAFLPLSHVDVTQPSDLDALIGQLARFRILELDRRRENLVVSRRKMMETDARAHAADLRGTIEQGQVFDGVVKRVIDVGAIVDIGGLEGLVHVSELSWDRVESPSDAVTVGQAVKVSILRYTPDSGKLSLSIRRLTTDPWSRLGTDFVDDGVYPGKVVRLEGYGAFVELAEGLDGLIHNTEASWDPGIREAAQVVELGQEVQIRLLNFDRKRRRVSLSLKAVEGDPWQGVEERYPVGTKPKGTVERVARFGVFVSLEPGVTGLLPATHSGVPRQMSLLRKFPVGAPITAEVIELDVRRRRLTLSLTGADEEGHRDMANYLKKQRSEDKGLGTFGDLLSDLKVDDD